MIILGFEYCKKYNVADWSVINGEQKINIVFDSINDEFYDYKTFEWTIDFYTEIDNYIKKRFLIKRKEKINKIKNEIQSR